MKGLLIFLGTIVVIPLIIGLVYWNTYNGLVSSDEGVKQTSAQVQNALQRQADLIPNLVSTVKAGAGHESATLTAVIEARAKAMRPIQLTDGGQCVPVLDKQNPQSAPVCDANKLSTDPTAQRQVAEAQQAMMNINVNALRESYPTLKGVALFATLTVQLETAQNRIAFERRRNQIAVQAYNQRVRKFPNTLVADRHGFNMRPYFEATEVGQQTPTVRF